MKKLKKFRDEDGNRDPKRTPKKLKPKRSLGERDFEEFKKQPAYKYLEEE